MENLQNFIRNYNLEILSIAAVLSLISFLLVIYNTIRTNKVIRKYKRLMRGADNKNLEAMLFQQLEAFNSGLNRINELDASCSALNRRIRRCVQNVGIVRYNAFDGMGSDQSFSLAFLDEKGDGLVLTNLYGRSTSTTFAKPVKGMHSIYPLSNEEKMAIEQAF
ncbi:MAG: DUF4446 family protein [Clostridia bacterium]|nr:DUF4446 family protein [Clostridia bacterium]